MSRWLYYFPSPGEKMKRDKQRHVTSKRFFIGWCCTVVGVWHLKVVQPTALAAF